jgi:hypothetical protein
VLDRFDAVIGAMLAVMALQWLAPSFIRLGMAG